MEVIGQPHALAVLPPGKKLLVPIGYEAGWAPRTENNIQADERTVRENRRITVEDIAEASICLVQWKELLEEEDFHPIDAVQNWLKTQPKNFFTDGIKKLVERWNRCVEVEQY
jgi:hypothetical protein